MSDEVWSDSLSDPRHGVTDNMLEAMHEGADYTAAFFVGELDRADKAAGIYRVSLDAAIEAAAEAECERQQGSSRSWESNPESYRAFYRDKVRPLVTAAVVGGAQ